MTTNKKKSKNKKACEQTLSGKHIWSDPINFKWNRWFERCEACGMVNDRNGHQ